MSATPWTKGLGKHYDDLIVAATTSELIDKGFLSPFRVFAPAHPDLSGVKIVAGDYHEGQLSEAMSQPVLVADTVSTWLRLGEDRPTLCFAVDRAHARKLADQFEAAGVPTGYVDANTPADERERIGRRLREGQIKVVCQRLLPDHRRRLGRALHHPGPADQDRRSSSRRSSAAACGRQRASRTA